MIVVFFLWRCFVLRRDVILRTGAGDIEHSGIFDLFPKISKKENKSGDFVKSGVLKVPRPRPVPPSLLRPICQACVNSQLSPTPPTPPRGREKKNLTKMNF